jgi:undecaprenyl-diphosphatase
MTAIESIFLAIVQGLTEFLPVSSSGHLVLFQKIFGIQEAPVFFDTMVHGATLAAVIFYLRKDILDIIFNIRKNSGLIINIIIGTLPAVFFGLFFKDFIEKTFDSFLILSLCFFITAVILFLTKFFGENGKDISQINKKNSFLIGIFQAASILPSISRSGATIASGIFQGINRKSAFKFSFLLSIPAIAGAMVLQIFDIGNVSANEIYSSLWGVLPALIFGFMSLRFLDKYMANKKFSVFFYYCLLLSIVSLVLNYI